MGRADLIGNGKRHLESEEGRIVTDAGRLILRVNKAFCRITGYTADEVTGKNPALLGSGLHDKAFFAAMNERLDQVGAWQGEIWNRRKNGEVYPEWLTISAVKSANGEITHYLGTLTDVSERKSVENELRNLAFYDPLTRLPNRRLLLDRLQQAMTVSARYGKDRRGNASRPGQFQGAQRLAGPRYR
jgi:PAS domain S-box-containing protein